MDKNKEQKEQNGDNMVTHGNSSKIWECLSCTIFLYVKLHYVYFGLAFHLVLKYSILSCARPKFRMKASAEFAAVVWQLVFMLCCIVVINRWLLARRAWKKQECTMVRKEEIEVTWCYSYYQNYVNSMKHKHETFRGMTHWLRCLCSWR